MGWYSPRHAASETLDLQPEERELASAAGATGARAELERRAALTGVQGVQLHPLTDRPNVNHGSGSRAYASMWYQPVAHRTPPKPSRRQTARENLAARPGSDRPVPKPGGLTNPIWPMGGWRGVFGGRAQPSHGRAQHGGAPALKNPRPVRPMSWWR